jgi:hypothetical protein
MVPISTSLELIVGILEVFYIPFTLFFSLVSFDNLIISMKSINASRNIIILQGDDFSVCTLLLFNSLYIVQFNIENYHHIG